MTLEDLVATLKRFLGFRTPSSAQRIDEASQDRPPPERQPRLDTAVVEPAVVEPAVVEPAIVEPAVVETTPLEAAVAETSVAETPVEAPVEQKPANPEVADQVAEIRALLESMAEAPAAAPAETETPEAQAERPEGGSEAAVTDAAPASTLPSEPATEVTAPAGSLVLTLLAPPTTFTIAKSGATLGRGEDNTIRLDDLSVSRRHSRIAYRQGGYWLSDLSSMGGTWVGEARLDAAQRIEAGDVIDIGHYRLTASFAGEPRASDAREPKASVPREPKPSTPQRRPSKAR